MVTIRTMAAETFFIRPDDAQLRRLFQILTAARPALAAKTSLSEFGRAVIAAGHAFRIPDVSKRAFVSLVDDANSWLHERDLAPVNGHAFLAGIIMHNDIVYRLGDEAIGEITGAGLDPHHGAPCSNGWKGVLDGNTPLRQPLPPREILMRKAEASSVRIYEENPRTKEMQLLVLHYPRWR